MYRDRKGRFIKKEDLAVQEALDLVRATSRIPGLDPVPPHIQQFIAHRATEALRRVAS